MTADDVAAQIAQLDDMIERCDAVARRAIPIKPDMSLPRYVPPKPAPMVREQNHSPRHHAPVSWEPQQRYEQISREGGNYRPVCSGSYGADVDAAFEACSNAPY